MRGASTWGWSFSQSSLVVLFTSETRRRWRSTNGLVYKSSFLWWSESRLRSQIQVLKRLWREAGLTFRDRTQSLRRGSGYSCWFLHIEMSQLSWISHVTRMPPGHLLDYVFWACPTCWRDYVSPLAWNLCVPREELEEVWASQTDALSNLAGINDGWMGMDGGF